MKEGRYKKIYTAIFPKSNSPNTIQVRAKLTQFVPGVGFYKNVENAYTQNIVKPKGRSARIYNSKFKRFSDEVAKGKSWVPGPGAYNILPPLRNK